MTKLTLLSFLTLSCLVAGCAFDSSDVNSTESEPSEEGEASEESDDGTVAVESAVMVEQCKGTAHKPEWMMWDLKGKLYYWALKFTVRCPERRTLKATTCLERRDGSAWKKVECWKTTWDKKNFYYQDGAYRNFLWNMTDPKPKSKGVYRSKLSVVESTGYKWSDVSPTFTVR